MKNATMNTFKKYSAKIPDFFQSILNLAPDYIVPVERKGCKLLRSLKLNHNELNAKIRYRQFFDNTKPNIVGKKIAIIDDASKYTSTLFEYREYFERLGGIVDTYSFVGQDLLRTAAREQYDKKANILQFLNESTYQEYIIQQSIELSKEDNSFDVDHLVFRAKISKKRFKLFFSQVEELGKIDYTNDVYTPEYITKFCLYDFTFPIHVPFDSTAGVYMGALKKIRFAYNEKSEMLSIVPLNLVSWNSNEARGIEQVLNATHICPLYEVGPNLETEGMYMNIVFICNLYLLKVFLSQINDFHEFTNINIEDYDLLAYVGSERIGLIKNSVSTFLKCNNDHSLYILKNPEILFDRAPKFNSIMSIMKHLRNEYERRLEIENSVLGIKYFLSYDELFARYAGRASLMKWIDILCDQGVMVARNINVNGIYYRACRSGEGDFDHTGNKTSILLPIVINTCGSRVDKVCRVTGTLLNKIIANLAYDYPNDIYDFHNFFTKPYFYGPFSYVKSQLNEEVEISLYDAEKISKYCRYDDKEKEFIAVGQEFFSKDIDAFSQSDMVPLTEITSYVDCLHQISIILEKADALNELAICRDQNIYYCHVHFDLITAYNNILTAYQSQIPTKSERYLRDAAKVANEAVKKLNYNQKDIFDKVYQAVGTDIRYRPAYQRILASKVEFSDSFMNMLTSLQNVAYLEQALINAMLYRCTFNRKYLSRFCRIAQIHKLGSQENLGKIYELYKAETDDEYNRLYKSYEDTLQSTVKQLCEKLDEQIRQLPKPKNSNYILANRRQNMDIAINRCIQHIKKYNLSEYTLLHFDYSGYRNIDGSKAINVVECVQTFVSSLLKDPGQGLIVYGLTGEHNCGTVIFSSVEKAIEFASAMRTVFADPNLSQINFKFGCCCQDIKNEGGILHNNINEVWEKAAKCSSQKTVKEGFVIMSDTYAHLSDDVKKDFMLAVSEINDANTDLYYIHREFEPVDSAQIIKYTDDTDDSIEIGIITALTEEFVAMQKMLIDPQTAVFPKSKTARKTTSREYCIGKIRSLDGKEHRIALTQTLGPGNTSAAMRANSLLERFPNLNVIIMTGIAGGIPSPGCREKHVRLGDIVVSKSIVSYDFVSERSEFTELRDRNVPPSARLCEAQNRLNQCEFMDYRPWEAYIDELGRKMPNKFARPDNTTDILYDNSRNVIPHPEDDSRTAYPRIFKEKIASANRVLKNPARRDQLKKDYDVYAVEMESSGIANATWEAEIGYYVVRGISDYCDGNKNDIWHNYAALVAAAYTRSLIEKLPY